MGLHPDRFRHFLWVVYPMLFDGLILSPTHQDLRRVADASGDFLSDAFSAVPKDSGVKAFLGTPNEHGWDVKRKLVWLGTHSFMFRMLFARYMEEQPPGGSEIEHTDDFVCQECTRWSGLGAIDILAGVLDVSEDDRRTCGAGTSGTLPSTSSISVSKDTLQTVNVINDQSYRDPDQHEEESVQAWTISLRKPRAVEGEWYWSGEQRLLGDVSKVDVDDLKRTMKRQSPAILCRYSKEYETQVRQLMSELHEKMLVYHGKDLTVYPDGLSMAADWQKELREQWESRPQQQVKEVVEKHGLKKGRPEMQLPNDLLEDKDGLGVFLNPDEGKEIMTHFTTLIAGLKKKGEDLTEEEQDVIRGFFDSDAVSPMFVRRVLEEYGDESVEDGVPAEGRLAAILVGLPSSKP